MTERAWRWRGAIGTVALVASVLAGAGFAATGSGGRAAAPPRHAWEPAPGTVAGASSAMRGKPRGVDGDPSADAVRVLSTIPEPLTSSERTSPAGVAVSTGVAVAAPISAFDSLRSAPLAAPALTDSNLATAADSAALDSSAMVPVPTPTRALGDTSLSALGAAAAAAAIEPAPASAPPAAAAAAGVAVAPAPCWRVQFGAPTERAKADALRDAIGSLLMLPATIETEAGRHKVRTLGCLSGAAADSLRRRAIGSGFDGAFKFGGTP